MTTAMESLKDMIEVNTIIGDPVETNDGTVIIPVSQLGFGFAAGGSEFNVSSSSHDDESSEAMLPFGGGSGGGVSITPVAFLVVSKNGIKMVHLNQNAHIYEKMIELAPQAVDKLQQIVKDSGVVRNNKRVKTQKRKREDDDEDYEESNYTI